MFYGIKFLSKYLEGKKKGSTFALAKRERGHASGTFAGEAGALFRIPDRVAVRRGVPRGRSWVGLPENPGKNFFEKSFEKICRNEKPAVTLHSLSGQNRGLKKKRTLT